MLENIFLMAMGIKTNGNSDPQIQNNGSSHQMYTQLAYPDESELFNIPEIKDRIFESQRFNLEKDLSPALFNEDFLSSNLRAIRVDGINVLVVPLPKHYILGLVFDLNTNPYDYRMELVRLLLEYFLVKFAENEKDKIKTTLLLTLFVDLRKYADESLALQKDQNSIMVDANGPIIKMFVYGIDNAGKSSLMRLLATGKFDHDYFPPTKKFRITNIKLKSGSRLVAWDMPGQLVFRQDWLRGAQASNIMLFMLDSNDKTRYNEAKKEFWNMLNVFELQGLPVIFLVNKIDLLPSTPEISEIISFFNLDKCTDRDWKIIFTSLPSQTGIPELENWLDQKAKGLLMSHGLPLPEKAV